MKTQSYKDSRYGWKAETTIDLGDNKEIHILTMKRYNGSLATTAQQVTVERGMTSHMMYGDFSKLYKNEIVRCTEKSVLAQHNAVIDQIEQIKADCAAFYKGVED